MRGPPLTPDFSRSSACARTMPAPEAGVGAAFWATTVAPVSATAVASYDHCMLQHASASAA